jgi:regulator of sigma E protease
LELIAFILILSLLVFVHELGHFIVAKRAGITVEEFAIGFPPRAIKLWQEEGSITLDGYKYVIGRKVNVPRPIQPGAKVYAETTIDEQDRPMVTKLELIKPVEDKKEQEAKQNSFLSRVVPPPFPPKPEPVDERPTVIVDALTRPTEYAINLIPFGGYVRMVGEEDPSDPGSFASKSKKIRLAVLVAGSTMNLITAIVFFTLTAMSGVPETAVGTFITEVVPDTPAEKAGLQADDLIVGADDVEFKYDGDLVSYIEKTKGTEITLYLERDGEIVTTSLVPRANPPEGQGAMGVLIRYIPVARVIITEVLPDTPAAKAGLQAGDVIVGTDDVEFRYAGDLTNYLEKTQGTAITLQLERDGEIVTAALVPRLIPSENNQDTLALPSQNQGALGIAFEYNYDTRINYYSPLEALKSGVSQTAQFVGLTLYMPYAILKNILPAEAARVTGPVGIYQQTASAVNAAVDLNWWFPVLWLTAVLSTALAVTNLLPLPALDGGRILFVIIEAIRGKRVEPEKEGAIHFIGLAFLLTLLLVISYYDLMSPLPTIDWASFF